MWSGRWTVRNTAMLLLMLLDGMSFMTECHRQQMEAREQHRPTAYVPECTDDGEFSPKQCHMAIHQCWCVYTTGRKVPGTERMSSLRLHCHKLRDPSKYSRFPSQCCMWMSIFMIRMESWDEHNEPCLRRLVLLLLCHVKPHWGLWPCVTYNLTLIHSFIH